MPDSISAALAALGPPCTATVRPLSSWPWQKGQCATTVPHKASSPGMSGRTSRTPVASTIRAALTRSPPSKVTAKLPSSGSIARARVSRISTVS